MAITFQPMTREDLPLVHAWHQRGRGLGTEMIRGFVDEIVFARPEATACAADPAVQNTASLRAFEKAGFLAVREFVDPEDSELHVLVRRERD